MPSQPNVSKAAHFSACLAAAGLAAGCVSHKADNPTPVPPPRPMQSPSTAAFRPPPSTALADPTIATIGAARVTQGELQDALTEAYGFNMLMLLVQRDMARDACAQQGFKVTPADLKNEYDWTLAEMFKSVDEREDRERLLEQFLAQPKTRDQMSTRAELAIILDTNAHLRKLVEPSVSRAVTDDMLRQQFDETYGAKAEVRHIVTDNPQDAMAARRRLDAGEDFAKVAQQVSRDPQTRRLGGELPPFTRNSARFPENFKEVAFKLKPGEISDPVQAGGGYHLIKLERIIEVKAVKFEDVKNGIRQAYEANVVTEGVKAVKAKLAQQALAQLKITEPTLRAEFDERMGKRDQLIRDREKMREQMEKDREAGRAAAATQPAGPAVVPPSATIPATAPATAPTTGPAIDPTTGLPTPAGPSPIRAGVAPIGVIKNGGGFTAQSATQPATAPATRP